MIHSYIALLAIGVLDTLKIISIEAYCASFERFYNRSRHFTNPRSLFFVRRKDLFIIFIISSSLCLPMLLYAFFAIFVFVTFDVVCLKSVGLKHCDCLSHFLGLNYTGLNLNFLRLAQLLIDGDIESNSGPTQNDCRSPRGRPKKIKVFKGIPKKFDLSENNNVNAASSPKVQNVFFQCNTTSQLKQYSTMVSYLPKHFGVSANREI